ncbi:MAG: histidine kinase [Saprospiraceae bacterium]
MSRSCLLSGLLCRIYAAHGNPEVSFLPTEVFHSMLRHFLPCILFLLLAPRLFAQVNGTISYTVANGLANGNFLTFLQDQKGYLWVGSASDGVSRFDGRSWQKWGIQDGLLKNGIPMIFEEQSGDLVFMHAEKGLSRYHDGVFKKCLQPSSARYFFDFIAKTIRYYDPQNGQILQFNDSTRVFTATGEQLLPQGWLPRYDRMTVNGYSESGQILFYARRVDGKGADIFLTTPAFAPNPNLLGVTPKENLVSQLFLLANGTIFLTDFGPRHFSLLENGQIKPFPKPNLPGDPGLNALQDGAAFYYDPVNHTLLLIWQLQSKIGNSPRYVLADYDLKDLHLRQTLIFSTNFRVNHCFKDRAGTYWVSTNGSVLRLFPEQFFISIETPNMPPSSWSVAQGPDGNTWFSSYGFGLSRFDGLTMHPGPPGLDPNAFFDNGSLSDTRDNLYFNVENMQTPAGQLRGLMKFDGQHAEILTPGTIGFFLAYDRQGRMMRGMHQAGLWILPKGRTGRDSSDWLRINGRKGLLLDNVLTALDDRYGHYWMGRLSQGLACYDPERDTVFNWLKSPEKPYYGVMSMDLDAKGNMWLGTDRGLGYLHPPAVMDGQFDPLTAMRLIGADYTGESAVTTLKLYDAHTLLFGNAQAVYLLDLDAFYGNPEQVKIQTFDAKIGNPLGAVEQNAAFITSEKQVWIMGAQGALRFDPRLALRDTIRPTIFIDSLSTDRETFTVFSRPISLGSGDQRVRVYFHPGLNPLLLDNIRFRYQLSGDSSWSALTESPWLEFPHLAPGHYTLQVWAEKYGIPSMPAEIAFRIAPLWWKNPWVWAAVLVMVIGVAVFILNRERKISNQQIQLEKTKTEMALLGKEKDKLQVQAIVNQLNPHFINNALQWLQVRVDEDDEAVRVVGKLSENIATVFKNSRQKKPFHTLRDELKLAENYLYIQKVRFRDRLQYQLPSEEGLQHTADIDVPLMILQIHVENAVEHGIRSKTDGTGQVLIELKDTADYVIINVTDDGVGRVAARQIGSRGTQNGTLMLRELASIYNRKNELPIEQLYEDGIFTTDTGQQFGTRVIIRIPKIYRYDI